MALRSGPPGTSCAHRLSERIGFRQRSDPPLQVEEHLGAEAARVEAEIERLRAELLLINEHLRLKRSERETHQSQATTLMTQAEMLRSALEPLEAARAKARLLLLNFEARK